MDKYINTIQLGDSLEIMPEYVEIAKQRIQNPVEMSLFDL